MKDTYKHNMHATQFLQATSPETIAEYLLELWDMVKVHQRVVLPRHVRI